MIRKITSLLLIVFLVSHVSFAQKFEVKKEGGYARVVALGYNPYVVDPEFVKYNAAWGSKYDNFVWGDIGGYNDQGQFLAANFRVTNTFTLGAMFARNDLNTLPFFAISQLDVFNLVGNVPNTVNLNNNLELFGTFTFGNTNLGIGVSYASSGRTNTPATGGETTVSASQIGINAGILTEFSKNTVLDLGVDFILPSASNEPVAPITKTEISQTIIAANARLFMGFSDRFKIIPTVGFGMATGSLDANNRSTDLTAFNNLFVGVGFEYKTGDFLFVGGPGFDYRSSSEPAVQNVSPEIVNSVSSFPIWNLGAEWKAIDWLVARIGWTGSTQKVTNQSTATSTTVDEESFTQYQPYGLNLGVGLRFGKFGLDATVNSDVLRNGLANIGGTTPTFGYLSMSYNFE
ncbi:MAG: outer membrane beta-barrel protein [Syntrophothermus sp.]